MALFSPLASNPWDAPDGPATPCFLCGFPLGESDAFCWSGASGFIYLHTSCIPSFARRMLEDWERANSIPVKREQGTPL